MLASQNYNIPISLFKHCVKNQFMSNDSPSNIADYFKTPITQSSVGSANFRQSLAQFLGHTYCDALYHLPTGAVCRDMVEHIDLDIHLQKTFSFTATIAKYFFAMKKNVPHRVSVMTQGKDGPLEIQLVYFKSSSEYLKNIMPIGTQRIISGKLESFDMRLQMIHPDFVVALDRYGDLPNIQPLYGLTAGITQRMIGKSISQIASNIPTTSEWIHPEILKKYDWDSFDVCLKKIHIPDTASDTHIHSKYRKRLAYDRILAHQLRLGMVRHHRQSQPFRIFTDTGKLYQNIKHALPFDLTDDQKNVIDEIKTDLHHGKAIARLIQGDVGSGKTLVALCSASFVVEHQAQAAIMTPTEILAKQHYASLKDLCDAVGIRLGLLTGKDKPKDAKLTLEKLASGEIDILIGTHALIQERVIFKNLALGIIDEQHRFGVKQRDALSKKGVPYAHILLMTATPIPRSLAMTHYGDTDLSIIKQKPPGRKPITTKVMSLDKIDDIIAGLHRVINNQQRIYWVCPLVEESEKMDLMAAQMRYESLQKIFGDAVGLVHGKMKTAEKDAVIDDFVTGKISVLVATTVIEVGVNVPQATVMIIEESERFGLSQLHQLRGRVGRGDMQSSCVLLYKSSLSRTAFERLNIIRTTEDGFILAEKDLELRGSGDFLGTQQTGMLNMQGFDFSAHSDLVPVARQDVKYILEMDYKLQSQRGTALRILLDLFETDRHIVTV